MTDYVPESECILTPQEVRRLRAKAEMADRLAGALRLVVDAAEYFYDETENGNVIGDFDAHKNAMEHIGPCLLAEYDALGGDA